MNLKDRVVMSFWRFDNALKQERKEAWDEGFLACAKYEKRIHIEYPNSPQVPENPYRESK